MNEAMFVTRLRVSRCKQDGATAETCHGCPLDQDMNQVFLRLPHPSAKSKCKGIIVDPTIRFKVECHQSAEVHLEKMSIREPTVNYFKLKYALIHVEVFGLLIGARGTIPPFFEEFRRQFALPTSLRDDIVIILRREEKRREEKRREEKRREEKRREEKRREEKRREEKRREEKRREEKRREEKRREEKRREEKRREEKRLLKNISF
ncbi:hypothetical protein ANN_24933 [Periplaneta americana]|uniref:Uncharacterized protein n=1 Tax=Periplaneta americana TaxID=6978 RepID=A0ABQ8S013_PERAM|nr:hypothetical protein ANN_24933 [Periplaneta americana]